MTFDGPSFIHHVAERLIHEFKFAGGAGSPGLVGAAKEHPARKQFERLMPGGVAIGSGIVVDSYGGMSRQQDIVVYETLCPIFTHNDTPEATFFPVEGVIACGEIKSGLGKKELSHALANCASAKSLKRHAVATDGLCGKIVSFRHYCSQISMDGTVAEQFDQNSKSIDQIFSFILCEKFTTSAQTIMEEAAAGMQSGGATLLPNFIASLQDGFISPHISTKNSLTRSLMDGDGLVYCPQPKDGFSQLLSLLRLYVSRGRTVERSHFERYFLPAGGIKPSFAISGRVAV